MQHDTQRRKATLPTVRVKNTVSCSIFDDKIKAAGSITVEKGRIVIDLDHAFSMTTDEAQKELLLNSIMIGLGECFDAHQEAFDPHY